VSAIAVPDRVAPARHRSPARGVADGGRARARGLRFGTSGIPRSSARPDTPHGIARARELGLDHLEMAWVNGVRMGDAAADRIAEASRAHDVSLTAHAPYYVNLCGQPDIVRRSIERLVATGRLAHRCGAASFCFHAGFFLRLDAAEAMARVRTGLEEIVGRLSAAGATVDVRPELTGKPSQLGSLDEILSLSHDVPGVAPCVDFSHQYARDGGATNHYEDFAAMLDRIEERLGRSALDRLHVHLSGIQYGPRGERRHEPLVETRFRYREVLRALRDRNVSGWVVCESPAMEEDARRLQRAFGRLR
jgi:deoxyribonuclease-4